MTREVVTESPREPREPCVTAENIAKLSFNLFLNHQIGPEIEPETEHKVCIKVREKSDIYFVVQVSTKV